MQRRQTKMSERNLKLMQEIEEIEGLIKRKKSSVPKIANEKSAEESSSGAGKAPESFPKPKAVPKKEKQKNKKEQIQSRYFLFENSWSILFYARFYLC